jgi:hypothetical protein
MTVQHLGEASGLKFSPAVFQDFNAAHIWNGEAVEFCQHFTAEGTPANGVVEGGIYAYYAAGSLALLATEASGVARLTLAADNNNVTLTTGRNVAGLGKVVRNSNLPFAFEARVRVGTITDDQVNWFVGLMEEGRAIADVDYAGFRVLVGDGNGLDAVHRTSGGAEVEVQSVAQTLVANTWYNLGFRFNGGSVCQWYINNAQVGANVDPTLATFPSGEELAAVVALKDKGNNAGTLDVDFIRAIYAVSDLR